VKAWTKMHRIYLAAALIGLSVIYATAAAANPDFVIAMTVFYIAVVITIFVVTELADR
jgi:uncharacterized membrane protein